VCENLLAKWQPRVYYAYIHGYPKDLVLSRESMKFPALLCMFDSLVDSPAAYAVCKGRSLVREHFVSWKPCRRRLPRGGRRKW
jgi:hypothetical protein